VIRRKLQQAPSAEIACPCCVIDLPPAPRARNSNLIQHPMGTTYPAGFLTRNFWVVFTPTIIFAVTCSANVVASSLCGTHLKVGTVSPKRPRKFGKVVGRCFLKAHQSDVLKIASLPDYQLYQPWSIMALATLRKPAMFAHSRSCPAYRIFRQCGNKLRGSSS